VTTYGVLGVGSIASAVVTGLCDGVADPPEVVLSPRNAQRSAALAARLPTVRVAADNQAVVDRCDVVVVCLLPAHVPEVLAGLRFRADQAVVSAAAGVDIGRLAALVAPATDIARAIPLPAVANRGGMTPVHPATPAATELFGRLGGSMAVVEERAYESLVAGSATVAAHFHYLGAIADWLSVHGVAEGDARRYVADTFAALSGELGSSDLDFRALAAAHSTPGGLNEQFSRGLEAAGARSAVRRELDELLARILAT
jgi:pyrroline-5-carboxylate reductase